MKTPQNVPASTLYNYPNWDEAVELIESSAPVLTGTEKQVDYANTLRAFAVCDFINEINRQKRKAAKRGFDVSSIELIENKVNDFILTETSAGKWIDVAKHGDLCTTAKNGYYKANFKQHAFN